MQFCELLSPAFLNTMPTRYRYIVFCAYFLILGYMVFVNGPRTQFTEELRDQNLALTPFATTNLAWVQLRDKAFVDQYVLLFNFIGNILLFIPFGFLIRYKSARIKTPAIVVLAFLLSCSIETIQYLFLCGVTDIDDVLLNTLGAYIGCLIAKRVSRY